jgi:hypothetical protein
MIAKMGNYINYSQYIYMFMKQHLSPNKPPLNPLGDSFLSFTNLE